MSDRNKQKTKNNIAEPIGLSQRSAIFVLAAAIIFSGALYLYQVNDRATKGYEVKEIENQLRELEKESKKMKIREVELRSMYNIERSTGELDLVGSNSMTYLELDSSVAMK